MPDRLYIADLIGPSAVAVGFGARTARQVMNLIADKAQAKSLDWLAR